ncbi:MAG: FtsX-like permease family protein [Planctomycetota bacterium]|nr:FtsX-like permease family protein [Planctomycetota bacterium]
MTTWRLIFRSAGFYLRGHLGVAAGVSVATAVLVGALAVGDSVRFSLAAVAERRLGDVTLAGGTGERFFRAELAADLSGALDTTVAPVISLNGTAVNPDTGGRANQVQVLGVDRRFWRLGGVDVPPAGESGNEVVLNTRLADRLMAHPGDSVVLRVRRQGLLPGDAPMSSDDESPAAMRLTVKSVASDARFGRFSLRAEQVAPMTAFVPLETLQEATLPTGRQADRAGRANMLLVGKEERAEITPESARSALVEKWKLADAELELRELPGGYGECRTGRVFIDHPVEQAAKKIFPDAVGILTYFVTEIRCGDRKTPYSMVTAIGPRMPTERGPWAWPNNMKDDEIVLNRWLADDLGAKVGNKVELEYFVIGPMRKLQTRTSRFRVRFIAPMTGIAADKELMPRFPGIAGVKNCKDWTPGVDFVPRRIRDKDEDYWDRYGGAPKAFVTLPAGKKMWSNRFGGLTAIRFPLSHDSIKNRAEALRRQIDPASVGLFFRPVGAEAVEAGKKAMNFGTLFLGMSFFLMASAVLLVGLLFVFSARQRSEQVGALLAMGFRPQQVRRMLLIEGGVVALLGGAVGTFAGLLYTKAIIHLLGTVWTAAAAGTSTIRFGVEPITLAAGGTAGVLISIAAMWITLRGMMKLSAVELLTGASAWRAHAGKKVGLWIGAALVVVGVIILSVGARSDRDAPVVFFAAGAAMLAGVLSFIGALMSAPGRSLHPDRLTLSRLAFGNITRRPGRSLATVALLACGVFLIVAVGANRKDPRRDSGKDSPTGGFALYGESALPVSGDLNDAKETELKYGLTPSDLEGARFVQLRIHEGDDASCLNLNRPQRPKIMGVEFEQLQGRFTFARTIKKTEQPWLMLNGVMSDGAVPAVGDQATIVWALGKAVGDMLPYTDERGRSFQVRLVGSLAGSVLQGGLIISERNFTERFGSESGFRAFLIEVPAGRARTLTGTLTGNRRLSDLGLELSTTHERLAAFYGVNNTYISIFQALGSLGLLLGSAGLSVVVLRNVLERRGELALLRAVGFSKPALYRLVLYEHWSLLTAGLFCGSSVGFVAVIPALRSAGGAVPYLSLSVTLAALACGGILWIYLATAAALRRPMLSALRGK